jgi:YD repeat-containing protein
MRSSRLLFFTIVLGLSFGTTVAQNDPTLDIGLKPYGSYHGGDLDSVNLSNGNLTLHIPLVGYPQRGSLGYTPRIIYNNKGWSVVPNCNSKTGICSPYWTVGTDPSLGDGVSLDMTSENNLNVSWRTQKPGSFSYVFSASSFDGSSHQLAPIQAGGLSSLDGTAFWYDGSTPTNLQPSISRDREGNRITGGNMEDANGNFFGGYPYSSVMTDTLGRSLPLVYTNTTDFSGCTGPLAIAYAGTYSLPGLNNASRILKVCYAAVSLKSNFQTSGYYNNSQTSISDRSYTSNQIQSIVLYNGTSWSASPAWTFEYNSRNLSDPSTVNYGDLTKITLPTGGTISYAWDNLESCDPNAVTPMSRKVISRTVDANDVAGPHTWTYNGGLVTDPAGNDTLHTFTALNNSCSLYETKTQYFQGSYQSGHLLKTVNTDYQWIANPFDIYNPTGTLHTVTNVFPIRVTTTLPNGKVTKVEKDYDTNLIYSDPVHGWTAASYGNVIEEREFDYGSGAPGPLLRRTDYAYKAFDGSPSAAAYLAANLVSLVSSITTYDGAGNQMAQTKYGYDEFSLQSSGLTSQQHDTTIANPGTRGNRTSESHWLNTTGSMVTSTVTYYDTGTPYQMTDPLGHVTTNTYGTGFQSGTNFIGAYVTQTQNALQQNTLFDYDFGTGLRTGLKDANGKVTTWGYDFLNRTLQTNAPDGGSTSWTYNDTQPPTFTASSTITAQLNRLEEGDMDGLGRAIHTKLTSDPDGVDTVDTTYDVLGRVATVSNPHRAGTSSTDGITTSTYDPLGRVTQTTKQDGSISTVKYNVNTTIAVNGDCTITTDEAGNQRGACTDALGRVVEVDEPNPGVTLHVNNYATMQPDGNFVLYNPSNSALWSSGTSGTSASSVFMQDDGNLVLYIFKWSAGTYAAPSPGPFAPQSCSIGTYLIPGGRINANQCIVSPHGQYMLYMDPNGNFYIYDIAHGTGTWGANTAGHPGAYATLQTDGNFVVYSASNVALWNSGTAGTNAERLDMEDDGRIIIYKSAWNSGTSTGQFNWTQLAHPGCDVGTGTGTTGMLGAGQCFVSPNGHFELLLQTDGNMAIYDLGVTPANLLWSTNTTVSPADPGVALRTLYSYDALGNLTCVEQHGDSPAGSHGDGTAGTGCNSPPSSDATSTWRVRRFTYDSLGRLLTAKNPESGTISYTYDNDGNLLQKTSPAPNQTNPAVTQTISYCYDALHRVTGKAYSAQTCQNGQLPVGTAVVSYTYDQGTNGVGHLTFLTDQAGTGNYTYDPMGRIASEQRTIAGVSKSMSYSYNLDGSLSTATYPSGAVITYTPSGAGRMLSVVDTTNTINYVTGATYTPGGSLDGFVSGSGGAASITNTFTYNKRLQPVTMSAATSSATVFSIGYDFHAGNGTAGSGSDNGNVFGITNYKDSSRNQTFTYDSLTG